MTTCLENCDPDSSALNYHFFPAELQDLLQSNQWQFPTYNEDLVGAMAALFRLQDTYDISAADMASNNIAGERRRIILRISELILCMHHDHDHVRSRSRVCNCPY